MLFHTLQLSSLVTLTNNLTKMYAVEFFSTLVVFLVLCCSLVGATCICKSIMLKVRGICPFYNLTAGKDNLPHIQRNDVIFHFLPLFTSGCSPFSRILICSTLFPFCSPHFVLLPCQNIYFSVYAACHHVFITHQEWPAYLNCSSFPSPPSLCLLPSPFVHHSLPSNYSNSSSLLMQSSQVHHHLIHHLKFILYPQSSKLHRSKQISNQHIYAFICFINHKFLFCHFCATSSGYSVFRIFLSVLHIVLIKHRTWTARTLSCTHCLPFLHKLDHLPHLCHHHCRNLRLLYHQLHYRYNLCHQTFHHHHHLHRHYLLQRKIFLSNLSIRTLETPPYTQ